MFDGASAAIDKALEETGQKSLNVASYCVGDAGRHVARLYGQRPGTSASRARPSSPRSSISRMRASCRCWSTSRRSG